ncbi:hypothetical protein GWI33_022483 [Rhynchophorus ferrugineus]|uniref:UDP-glucuronosyltransferase n=1 Tax=Rhynchophorus ferrugineus TaxID=354439 RepID=A0A834M4G3_RHYFE|nr:hypothetical protein GWI33_022484 [Rhynchophorus ferrugineus]KAF7264749.1 hypothetical protein GWI33_022483 [Rhynchophorus ferrugineus]
MTRSFNIRLLLVLFCVRIATSYNILVILSHPGKSHVHVFAPMIRELGQRGHKVTVVTHVPVKDISTVNVKEILIGEPMVEVLSFSDVSPSRVFTAFQGPFLISSFAHQSCVDGLSHPAFQSFLRERHSFDVILYEFFNTNCYFGLTNKYKAPFIGLSTCGMMPWHANWFGSPQNPSVHQVLFTGFSQPMTFLDRVENTIEQIVSTFWYKYEMETSGRKYSKKYIGEEAANPQDASLFLVNTHHTLHGARPLTPSIIEVGGIHVHNKEVKKLPPLLGEWIDEADDGVIYFSFGSMIKGETLTEEKKKAFTGAFSRLSQRVLWKWENETMMNKPNNVMIQKWMPQYDILCNPKVKVFIGHGGLLGTIEAINCGVPMIVMPQFGDQVFNARYLENNGGGLVLPLHEVTEDNLYKALKILLSPESQKKAKELSARFSDRPMSPMDTAIYWIEHVVRHKGAAHMRSATIDLPFYQYFLIDVLTFLAVVLLAAGYIASKTIKFSLRLMTKTNKTKAKLS